MKAMLEGAGLPLGKSPAPARHGAGKPDPDGFADALALEKRNYVAPREEAEPAVAIGGRERFLSGLGRKMPEFSTTGKDREPVGKEPGRKEHGDDEVAPALHGIAFALRDVPPAPGQGSVPGDAGQPSGMAIDESSATPSGNAATGDDGLPSGPGKAGPGRQAPATEALETAMAGPGSDTRAGSPRTDGGTTDAVRVSQPMLTRVAGEAGAAAQPRPLPRIEAPMRSAAERGGTPAVDAATGVAADGPGEAVQAGAGRIASRAEPPAGPEARLSQGQRGNASRMAGGENAPVRVLEAQSFPAPPQPAPTGAVASVVNALGEVREWSPASAAALQPGAAAAPAGPVRSLTIQLHPVELGTVTATLRTLDGQMSIELQVERAEAYRQLTVDSDTILKAVQSLGIDVERITIQQHGQSHAPARADSPAHGASGQDGGFSSPGARQEGDRSGGSSGGRGSGNSESFAQGSGMTRQEPVDRGVYI